MANLKKETLDMLREHGKSLDQICWVGTAGIEIPLCEFLKEADRHYDNSYGIAEVNECLLVVGDDWWLERHEYDGAEWWEYKERPRRPDIIAKDNIYNIIF